MKRWVLLALLAAALVARAAADCAAGDLPCACSEAGGEWRNLQSPLRPVCTFSFKQSANGNEITRYFNVFLPEGYRQGHRYPVWMHIHGVYWGSMDNISDRMGFPVLAMDATSMWDGIVGSDKAKNMIVVYPQSTPSPYTDTSKRMLWNLPWWRCSSGSCVDPAVDDLGYMDTLLATLTAKFPVDRNRFYATGTSAGGMMINLLLCQSELFQRTVTAAVDILGGVGEAYLGQCTPKRFVPHLILHGMDDPIITYWRDNVVDNSNFISTVSMAKWWQKLQGCTGEPRAAYSNDRLECSLYCDPLPSAERRPMVGRKEAAMQSPAAPRGGSPALKLCGMKGVGHDLNTPYQGYPFDVAADFFSKLQ